MDDSLANNYKKLDNEKLDEPKLIQLNESQPVRPDDILLEEKKGASRSLPLKFESKEIIKQL